jgi:hypothetical protein
MFSEVPERAIEAMPCSGRLKNPREIEGVSTGSYCSKIKCTPCVTHALKSVKASNRYLKEGLSALMIASSGEGIE